MKVIDKGLIRRNLRHSRTTSGTYFSQARVLTLAPLSNETGYAVNPILGLRENWNPETLAYEGILLEPNRTNNVLNSTRIIDTTQNRTLTAGTYTLSFYGTGSVNLSGPGYTTFTLVGDVRTTPTFSKDISVPGISVSSPVYRKQQTFTTTGGTTVITVTGTVYYVQIELGTYATSIIVTEGSTVNRAEDIVASPSVTLSGLVTGTQSAASEQFPSTAYLFPSYRVIDPATYALFTAGNSYSIGNKVVHQGFLYQALAAGILSAPVTQTTNATWTYLGADNPLKCLVEDGSIGTIGNQGAVAYVACFRLPSNSNSIAITGLKAGEFSLAFNNRNGTIITQSYAAGATDAFLEFPTSAPIPSDPNTPPNESLSPLTNDAGSFITIRVQGLNTIQTTIKRITVGYARDLGQTQYGLSTSITDYSVKTTDEFGNTSFVKRAFSKKVSARLLLDKSQYNYNAGLLQDLRATPTAWVATDDASYAKGAIVYGYYKDFSIDVSYPTMCSCSLEIEGLV